MKKSNKIIIILVAVCALIIAGAIIASRFIVSSSEWSSESGDNHATVTESIDALHFTGAATANSGEVTIEHDGEYLVKMAAVEKLREYLAIRFKGRKLTFSGKPGTTLRDSLKAGHFGYHAGTRTDRLIRAA